MAEKLELLRESKLYKLLPGKKKDSRLEASGVALVDDATALVIFDNLNLIGAVDVSLEPDPKNRFYPAPSIAEGFEDIALDHEGKRVFCIIEAMEDTDGKFRGFVVEYDAEGRLQHLDRLQFAFETENKGFEGLAYAERGGHQYLFAMCEGNLCRDLTTGGGRIQAFRWTDERHWVWSHEIALPDTAEFEDYAALSYRNGRLAVVSQASARLWIGEIDEAAKAFVAGSGRTYCFPKKSYGNVEGIAWLSDDQLVAVSDKKKSRQPEKCADKDQSIHVFRIPS